MRRIKPVLTSFTVGIVFVGFSAFSQNTREILTNEKIVSLVKLGLGDAVVVEKIRRSECRCDTSMEALAKLKAARVSDQIILAIMDSTASAATSYPTNYSESVSQNVAISPQRTNETSATDGSALLESLREPGIYLFEGGKLNSIDPSVFSGTKANFLKGALTYGIVKSKFRAKVRGKTANYNTSNSQPVFYFVFNQDYKSSGATMAGGLWWGMPATSPAEFMMVQMTVKEASREAVMGEYGAFTGVSTGARDKDIREYAFEKIKPGVYKVVPKTPLPPGEYCFYYAGNVAGLGLAGGKIFDFAVLPEVRN